MGNLVTTEVEPVRVVFTETKLCVEVISDHSAFLSLEPMWDRLVERANIDHPFVTFPWVHTWWECFGSGRKLHILVVKAGDEVIGIAPLMLTKRKIYGVKLRCLEFLANGHTPRFDVIVSRWPLQVYRAMWNHLQAERNLWDVLLLCQIPEGCPTLEQFSRLAEENQFAVGCWRSANAPYLLIQGDWESYLKSIKSKFRNNLCRRLRKLSELGQVTLEVVSSGEALGPALQDGLQLEGAAWKDKQGTSIRSRPEVRLFYTQLADKFAELGWLHLCFLKCNDRRIAFHYSIFYKSKSYLLKPGYDPAYAHYSPANLLCFLFLENAFRTGVKEFDLLGVDEEWKLQWTQNARPHYWLYVFSNGPLTSTLHLVKFRLLPALQQKRSYRAFRSGVVALRRRLGFPEANL